MPTYLTKAGVAKLEQELKDLQTQKRRLSEEIGRARELGDLRENAEYHAAKERLQQVMERIHTLQGKLSHVEVVDPRQMKAEAAILGMRITVKDTADSSQEQYILVGPDEADPAAGKISILSPLGKGFLGRKVKERVTLQLPAGSRTYLVLAIEPAE